MHCKVIGFTQLSIKLDTFTPNPECRNVYDTLLNIMMGQFVSMNESFSFKKGKHSPVTCLRAFNF